MSAPSPNIIESSGVVFSIQSDGKAIDDTISVEAIETFSSVNKVPHARLTILDGDAATSQFVTSDTKTFLPGAKIEIRAGYIGGTETVIFSGKVVRQAITIHPEGAPQLTVEIYDDAKVMTLDRKNAFFEKVKDSDLIGKLIAANGLRKNVAATSVVHPEIVQYYASDWDMMLLRAEANGMVVIAENGTINVAPPDSSTSPVLEIKFGDSILDFHAELNAASQFAPSAIEGTAWAPGQQKIVQAKAKASGVKEPGNVSSKKLAAVYDVKKFGQQTATEIDKSELQSWSDAEALRSALSKIRGSASFQGSALAKTGKMITLAGVGARFNGDAYISGVDHVIRDGAWITKVTLGLAEQSYAAMTPDIAAPGASGLLPPMRGLQIGIVKKVAKDPDGEFRVEIELPLLNVPKNTIWARMTTFYGSNKVGAVFYPEIGDEVIVGCMNEDPRFPVILGSTYSKKNPPPIIVDEKNDKKALVTRSKLTISFDDKDKIVEISTPGKNVIRLDDKAGSITISDSNKNSLLMDSKGVTIDSAADFKVTAKGNIVIDAGKNLDLSAKGNATLKGAQITHKAQSKFSASGSASAELKSSGVTTVKGSLVKIN